jgi:O-antigen ligase
MKWDSIKYQLFLSLSIFSFFLLSWNGSIPEFISPALSKLNLVSYAIGLCFVLCFFQDGFQSFRPFKNWLSITVFVFYLLYVVSVFTSKNVAIALKALEYKLSFILVCYTYFSNPLFFRKNKAALLKSFSLGLIILLLLLDFRGFLIYFETGEFPVYTAFTTALHPTYLGLCSFIVVVLCMKKMQDYSFVIGKKSIVVLLIGLFLILHILLVQSRSAQISLLLGCLLYAYQLYFKTRFLQLASFLGIVAISFFVLMKFPAGQRFKEMYVALVSPHPDGDMSGTNFRMNLIKSYPEVLSDIWLFGATKGDAQEHLTKFYLKKGWIHAAEENYNAHNQFLQVLIEFGIIGFLLFCLIFFLPFFLYHGFYFRIILMGFTISLLFESFLERQAGIFLFIFIYCLFNAPIENIKNAKLISR